VALKAETIGLAVSLELPLVICDIQRGGPSTGLPTKTEQADLLMAMYGRNGEAPVPIVAPQSPSDCFDAAIEACRIALKYRTPVFLLSDGYLANGSEPWRSPTSRRCPDMTGHLRDRAQPRGRHVLAVPARPGDARPAMGGAGHAGPRAPRRRHREAGRHGQHLLRPGQPLT
jgi:pyruvate/2-oxoacid:ferredoxin oxidoreductase alpha subunit